MTRREVLLAGPALAIPLAFGAAPKPIPEPHFPNRVYQYIWRNWELVNTGRMARVIGAREADVLAMGAAMGLPRKREITAGQARRIYITVIRQNWHLLPDKQIIDLLGWNRERYEFTLKEDDFLDVKLGPKPECPELVYSPPGKEERRRAEWIRQTLARELKTELAAAGEEPFRFVGELSETRFALRRDPAAAPGRDEIDLRRGWKIVPPADTRLAHAAARLRAYLREAMRVEEGEGSGVIRFEFDAAVPPRSFRVRTAAHEVVLASSDAAGAAQAVYWLADIMDSREGPFLSTGTVERRALWSPRFLYSYFALYGDPLAEPDIDPFPDGYLERLARTGIDGVWLQAVLRTLAPSAIFPEFGAGWENRLKNLAGLVRRAERFGLKIYLYLNEPRAMTEEFFRAHPEVRGTSWRDQYAMCTSVPAVRQWIKESLSHVFRHTPGLGGVFSITMSENFTNCFSKGGGWGTGSPKAPKCPRCSSRTGWETIAELLTTFRDGVKSVSPEAEVIAWDWAWGDELTDHLLPLLPKDVRFQSISEWYAPVRRGGLETRVGEYSISVVGPGPRAARNWAAARRAGLSTLAKVQFNNTWEISAVPYIPVPHLIVEHCEGLSRAGVSGLMVSWTCGGYPSPNLSAARAYYYEPRPAKEEVLNSVARQRYGAAAAPAAVQAWRQFADAFQEYPYGAVAQYLIPTHHGPANLLRLHPTGCAPSMILFPQDAVQRWCLKYPPEAVWGQFDKMASRWKQGLETFAGVLAKTNPAKRDLARLDHAIAVTCYTHFQSTANQLEFYILREKLNRAAGSEREKLAGRMRTLARQELDLARQQYAVARRHSTIAYEASNHYYYRPLDLAEKILNCAQILDELGPPAAGSTKAGGHRQETRTPR